MFLALCLCLLIPGQQTGFLFFEIWDCKRKMEGASWDSIPCELQVNKPWCRAVSDWGSSFKAHVFSFLRPSTLLECFQVNKRWYVIELCSFWSHNHSRRMNQACTDHRRSLMASILHSWIRREIRRDHWPATQHQRSRFLDETISSLLRSTSMGQELFRQMLCLLQWW